MINHVHELLQLMAVMTRDSRYEEIYSPDMEGGKTTMCDVLDRVENKGIEQGIERGIEQGEKNMITLMDFLLSSNRMEDLRRVTVDKEYRNKLLEEILADRK